MKYSLILLLAFFSTTSQASLVSANVNLNVSYFNNGPFTKNSLMNISFDIDTSVIPTSIGSTNPIYSWAGALDNFVITVEDINLGTLTFNGSDGLYRQFTQGYLTGLIKPATGYGSITPNPFQNDTVSGTSPWIYDPFILSSIDFDFRLNAAGLSAFSADQVVTNLTTSDFNYLRFTMRFDHPTASLIDKLNINTGGYFNSVTFNGASQSVPEPAPLALLGLGLLALGFVKKKP